jgi:hypothetical protein
LVLVDLVHQRIHQLVVVMEAIQYLAQSLPVVAAVVEKIKVLVMVEVLVVVVLLLITTPTQATVVLEEVLPFSQVVQEAVAVLT